MRELGDPAPPPPEGRLPGDWYQGPVPRGLRTTDLSLVRLTAAHAASDHEALMASRTYLRAWSDSDWPADGFSIAQNREELAWHDEEHEARVAFAFSIQDDDGRVLGCLYLRPLRDMLATRGIAMPASSGALHPLLPCARGWVRRGEPAALEPAVLAAVLSWLAGPAWRLPTLAWVAASSDLRQLAALDALGWTQEQQVPARPGLAWVVRRDGHPS
jgi:hypothetical protein